MKIIRSAKHLKRARVRAESEDGESTLFASIE